MFDVLAFPEPTSLADVDAPLRMPLQVGRDDETEFLRLGHAIHLGRRRRCAWHLAVHRDPGGGCWTHLYRVLPDHGGRAIVLLDRALEGDRRAILFPILRLPLPGRLQDCEAATNAA